MRKSKLILLLACMLTTISASAQKEEYNFLEAVSDVLSVRMYLNKTVNVELTQTAWVLTDGTKNVEFDIDEPFEINLSNEVYEDIYVSDALWATYRAPMSLDFMDNNNVDAYIVTAVGGNRIELEKVTEVPQNATILVNASAEGTYKVLGTMDVDDNPSNLLRSETHPITADGTQYILADGEYGVGFYPAQTGTTIAAGKGYLTLTSGAKFLKFIDDTTTGIEVFDAVVENNDIYNIAGQRINRLAKGINIINGRKILK